MQTTALTLHSQKLESELLPRLRGRVFQVSNHAAFDQIRAEGAIRLDAQPAWPHYKPYFRTKGCVSVCDLRSVDDRQLRVGRDAYNFLRPNWEAHPAFLVLAESCHDRLVPNPDPVEAGRAELMVVPYIEAGFPAPIPLDLVIGPLGAGKTMLAARR